MNRRGLLKFTAAGTVAMGLAITGVQSATATRRGQDNESADTFDEVYRGRRIQGGITAAGGQGHHGSTAAAPAPWVRIDGLDLHVMPKAGGGYLSATNHYEPYPSLRALARVAVDELNGADLVELPHR